MVVIVARLTFEAPYAAKGEEKRTTITSDNYKNLPSSNLKIYILASIRDVQVFSLHIMPS